MKIGDMVVLLTPGIDDKNGEKELQKEVEHLRRIVQAQNMEIEAAKWGKYLNDRGLLPYCNAPYPED